MKKNGYTLIEIIAVIVIIGVMATLSIPRMTLSIQKARARSAISNLTLIHSADLIYQARNNNHHCTTDSACTNLAKINNINGANSLNILASGVTYACADSGTECTATAVDGSFVATADLTVSVGTTNPSCPVATYAACP